VLVIGGLDPSGAGLQADIETCAAMGCHALPVATAVTIQNTRGLKRFVPLSTEDVRDQIQEILSDVGTLSACKIGMVPNVEVGTALSALLATFPAAVPVFLDPVLAASAGGDLTSPALPLALPALLLPYVTLIKPNLGEACRLAGTEDTDAAGRMLSHQGNCRYALLTGADTSDGTSLVHHYLYRDGTLYSEYVWSRLDGDFHGTGCTLTTAIAAQSALGESLERAVARALGYVWRTIQSARSIGATQSIPNRFAEWARPA